MDQSYINTYENPLAPQNQTAMAYLCADCGAENEIKPREPIRCRECGYRILYKKRTKRSNDSI
ncbi:hypothetical protein BB559_003470 [Furculomyces boomerangus]|uniref:DNA-directed RNA polymerase I, II, and III subunit RPABC4 n=2 Tax=Harpellales TaxID=61421 RepID=A0A2T9YL49_9FUNG|nr:hypothetical protein BB559_003470 [Furculomyces boomerangus]PWA01456.1 hypothetical protein BB558_002461 [Smittium angustum]